MRWAGAFSRSVMAPEERPRLEIDPQTGRRARSFSDGQLQLLDLEPASAPRKWKRKAGASCRRRVPTNDSEEEQERKPSETAGASGASSASENGLSPAGRKQCSDRLRAEQSIGCGPGPVFRLGTPCREAHPLPAFPEEQYREFLNAEFHGRYLLSLESVLTLKGEQN